MSHRRRLALSLMAVLGLLVGVFAALPGQAMTLVAPQMKRCPLGGEPYHPRFSDQLRLETKGAPAEQMAGAMVVLPLDRCPNGFLVYKPAYSRAELASLARLIADQEFKALRDAPTYARLHWIRARQGADPFELADLRFRAAREPYQPEVSRKYRLLYIQDAMALPSLAGREDDLVQARLRAVNLLREIGAFDSARAMLDVMLWPPSGPPKGAAQQQVIWALLGLLEDRNSERFAVTLYTPEGAAALCVGPGRSLSRSEVRHCRSSEIRAAMQHYCARLEAQNPGHSIEPACLRHRPVNRIVPPLAVLAALVLLLAMARRMRRADAEARAVLAGGGR